MLPAPEALPAARLAALPAPPPVAAPPPKPKGRPKLPKAPPLALPDVAKAPTPSPAPSAASASFGILPQPTPPSSLPLKRKPSGTISEAEIMSQAKAKFGGPLPYEMKMVAVPTATSKAAAKKGIDETSPSASSAASTFAPTAAASSLATSLGLETDDERATYGRFINYVHSLYDGSNIEGLMAERDGMTSRHLAELYTTDFGRDVLGGKKLLDDDTWNDVKNRGCEPCYIGEFETVFPLTDYRREEATGNPSLKQ